MQPYYEDSESGIVIYHGDCREILPEIDSCDAVVSDPPYGIHKADWDELFPTFWLDEAARIAPVLALMPGVWNAISCPVEIGRLKYRWMLAGHLINGMTRGGVGFGNWIPCLLYSSDEVSLFVQDGDIKTFVVGVTAKPHHPSPKPLAFMQWIVDRLPAQSVLDPFLGSGTTLVACKRLGRRGIGIEIEERYCEIAAKRLMATPRPLPFPEPAPEPEQLSLL